MNMTIGQYLRANREHMGYRVEDVSAAINIRAAQLRAIENGEIEKLPGMTYAVGFVKTYAAFLNLDINAVADQFKREHAGGVPVKQKKKTRKTITDDPYSDNRIPNLAVLGVAFLFILICTTIWWFSKPDTSGQLEALNQVPPPPVIETASDDIQIPAVMDEPEIPLKNPVDEQEPDSETVAITEQVIVAENEQTAQTQVKPLSLKEKDQLTQRLQPSRITINALETTWLEVIDGTRRSLYRQLLKKGESFAVPDVDTIYLSTGNAGALSYTVDGKNILPIGATGDILREIRLTPEILLAKAQ